MKFHPRECALLAAAIFWASPSSAPAARTQSAATALAAPPAPTATPVPTSQLVNPCSADVRPAAPTAPAWAGWSTTPSNGRFQSAAQAGLSAADVAQLQLKWAFGIPNVKIVRSQPAVYRGRVFVGANDGTLYALDAATACIIWATTASRPVRSGIAIGKASDADAVFFGDAGGDVFALDFATGKPLWAARPEDHPNATITGTPTYFEGRLYVPVSSGEEGARRRAEYECCTFRGSVVALDAATGKKIWQGYMAADAPVVVGKTKEGHNIFAPSGMAIWSAPTIDTAKNRIYVGTGDNYSEPGTKTSDAVVALDLRTGAILWSVQFDKDDVYKIDCGDPPREGCSPPTNPEFDLGASPILVPLAHGKRALVLGQKSGLIYAVDPDAQGKLLWHARAGAGGLLGGVQWGPATDDTNVYVAVSDLAFQGRGPDPAKGGGISAYRLSDGQQIWKTPPPGCGDRRPCSPAQSQAVTAIPGAVFSGSIDGHLRAYATGDGKVIWDFDTARDFDTVNQVSAHGGSLDVGGPIVARGMVFVVSGYAGFGAMPGNVLLAFAAK
ncbi:MAG TPA: PQQ-binding-like beta-propeller repeat protein [Candidatus Acidoferrales bacterium]|nr:PQQ-binding-like beta-propeller repeat protein [Candidatus Acidoferrales bacterium]